MDNVDRIFLAIQCIAFNLYMWGILDCLKDILERMP
jgi:hypothetical protein